MALRYKLLISSLLGLFCAVFCEGQVTVRGDVTDAKTGEALIGATVLVKGTQTGAATDYDGQFELRMPSVPGVLVVSYSGFLTQEFEVKAASGRQKIKLDENAIEITGVEIVGQRISEKQKAAPLTVEALDAIAVKETAQASVYNALGNLKGVDLTTASLGFTVINTRGFNSTSPVRSLQIIDGVDNQAPGLNFSLGNFLGCSDLDIQGVDLIVGASSAFYGPNAFNGVISMQTKSPFTSRGLAASIKKGERNLLEASVRWGDAWKNKAGHPFVAFKANLFHLRANDWVADNYDAVTGTRTGTSNPGGWDKVNVYGDEFSNYNDYSQQKGYDYPGLGIIHRTGYREVDLVDYDTRNYKASAALHFRTRPGRAEESPELILSSNFGSGTTVYQGDNRFSLRDILFFQQRLEFRKKDKFFIRAYTTRDDAGRSFDPYFTAIRMQNMAKGDQDWATNYAKAWSNAIPENGNKSYRDQAKELGYPQPGPLTFDPNTGTFYFPFDSVGAQNWEADHLGLIQMWHDSAEVYANKQNGQALGSLDFFQPGTDRFKHVFDSLTGLYTSQGGTRFYDRSALYHLQGEYKFSPKFVDVLTVGGSARLYTPYSKGTIFSDTSYDIASMEAGAYLGLEKELFDKRLRLSGTIRCDQNFEDLYGNIEGLDRREVSNFIYTPAASLVFKPKPNNFLRLSFSSALRNPTLSDKYLKLNVGRAILSGNLTGATGLATVESFFDALNGALFNPDNLKYFDIAPVKPEKVKTFEAGYRTTLFNKIYVDAGYYYSFYKDFLGYNIGLDVSLDTSINGVAIKSVQPYRYAANSISKVTSQGFAIGLNYYFGEYFGLSGNYSWNRLNTSTDDPIVPAFNTPKHKFNVGLSGRDMPFKLGKPGKFWGWNVTYKWIEGFTFEGSPQFTGGIPTYDLLDAQVNCRFSKVHTTVKLGCANLMNNKNFQAYGGPRIGRMAYASIVYDFFERN